jgi:hypothetical protein
LPRRDHKATDFPPPEEPDAADPIAAAFAKDGGAPERHDAADLPPPEQHDAAEFFAA